MKLINPAVISSVLTTGSTKPKVPVSIQQIQSPFGSGSKPSQGTGSAWVVRNAINLSDLSNRVRERAILNAPNASSIKNVLSNYTGKQIDLIYDRANLIKKDLIDKMSILYAIQQLQAEGKLKVGRTAPPATPAQPVIQRPQKVRVFDEGKSVKEFNVISTRTFPVAGWENKQPEGFGIVRMNKIAVSLVPVLEINTNEATTSEMKQYQVAKKMGGIRSIMEINIQVGQVVKTFFLLILNNRPLEGIVFGNSKGLIPLGFQLPSSKSAFDGSEEFYQMNDEEVMYEEDYEGYVDEFDPIGEFSAEGEEMVFEEDYEEFRGAKSTKGTPIKTNAGVVYECNVGGRRFYSYDEGCRRMI
jgi:hypothetical protein